MIKGIAFDFNGVIVDDELIHYRAFALTLAPIGIELSRDQYWSRYLAFDDRGVFIELARDYAAQMAGRDVGDLLAKKIDHYMTMVGAAPPFFPGAIDVVRALAEQFPMVIVSGARRAEIESTLNAGGLLSAFRGIIASEDVKASKPDPEPYVRGVALLGLSAGEVVAIEDSLGGISSAKAAGLKVVALTHTYRAEELGAADLIVPSLFHLTVSAFDDL